MTENNRTGPSLYTAEMMAAQTGEITDSARGHLLIAGCTSGTYLSSRVAERYREELRQAGSSTPIIELKNIDARFSDTETCVRLDVHVGGYDVFLFQSLLDPTMEISVDQNYMALLIGARSFRENGARHVTAVLPYLAYARQDKPTKFRREPTTAKLMADLSVEAGIDRAVVWDPHCDQIRGFYGKIPITMVESVSFFVEEFEEFRNREDVIAVAPDVGASKMVTHFGRAMNVKCAVASKFRPRPEEVTIPEIIGDFRGKKIAIVLDDMISGAGTVEALAEKLVREKHIEEVYLGASHNLCVGRALERLVRMNEKYGLKRAVITNSIPQTSEFQDLPFLSVECLSEPFCTIINRVHYNRSVSEAFYRE